MTTTPDKETVERVLFPIIRMVNNGGGLSLDQCGAILDTMRALAAEVDRLKAPSDNLGICADCQGSGESGPDMVCLTCNGSGAAQEPVACVEQEEIAKFIYEQMMWAYTDGSGNRAPAWVEGGNSFAQDQARLGAQKILSALTIKTEAEVRADERERCAKIAENTDVSGTLAPRATISAAIRGEQ